MTIIYLIFPLLLLSSGSPADGTASLARQVSEPQTIEGVLRLYGNEPFTEVALVTDDEERFYLLMGDEELARLWREQRGRIRVTGFIIDRDHAGRPGKLMDVIHHEWVEKEAADDAKKYRLPGIGLMIMLIPGSVFIFIYFYRHYGRNYKSDPAARKIRFSPPDDTPPALTRVLMSGPVLPGPDKIAPGITLFDLSRRGYFRIVEKSAEKKFPGRDTPVYILEKTGKKPDATFAAWEQLLYEKVNHRIDEGVTQMDKIVDFSTKSDRKWWNLWREEFRKTIRQTGWFDPAGTKVMIFHTAAQFPFLLGSFAVIFLAGAIGFLSLLTVIIMMLCSFTLPRYTPDGVERLAHWSGYRKALKKGPDHLFSQEDAGRHFVYSLAMGLSQKQLKKQLLDVPPDNPLFFWILPMTNTASQKDVASGLSRLAFSTINIFSGLTRKV